ncbi:spherulin-2A-like [Colias croceus]|uniref:spherulin-2A-like n=1 Tax=Colias crocea TaxID=72248 RepID=UPI001E2813C0|nr:spherulin-2A-like [Colias croceus]
MAFKFVLLVLPALALAKIDIELSGTFEKNLNLAFSGQEIDVISDTERETFQLTDSNLKKGAELYFGQWPDDIFVKSPTPWGDLYRSYGWRQVSRTLVPKRGRVLSMTTQPQIVMQQIFENNSSKPASFNVGISQAVQNTMSSSWSKSGDLTVGQEISYDFDIDFVNVGGKTSLEFSSSWGTNSEKSQTITVGSESHMELMLTPGQSVLAELHATRGSLKVEVEYEASLSGSLAVNYNNLYRDHHFWALDVRTVMAKAGLNNALISKQIMEIGFFTNSKVVVFDRKFNTKIMDVVV